MTARSEYHHLYNLSAWRRRLRPQHLAREPLCRACLRRGIVNDGSLTASGTRQGNPKRCRLVVDHVIPHRGDPALFLDPGNLQTLCPDDHDQNKQRLEARGYSEERGADGWPVDPQHPANYNNIEHQDLHLVKHTLRRWVKKFEQELTLKIFGRGSKRYVKLNLDGMMRGDFKTRIEAIVKAIQNGLMTPNEGRALENRAPLPGGDVLLVQGATVPIELAGKAFAKGAAVEAAPPPVATDDTTPADPDDQDGNAEPNTN